MPTPPADLTAQKKKMKDPKKTADNRRNQQNRRNRLKEEKALAEAARRNNRCAYTAYLPPTSSELDSGDGLVSPSRNRQIDLLAYEEEMEAFLANDLALMDVYNEGYTH